MLRCTGVKAEAIPLAPLTSARRSRIFHTCLALAFLITVFAGFAPTYYLKGAYGTPALSPLLHLHAAVFTAWLVLLVAQTALVAAHRTDLHKRLGIAGALLAALMIPLGVMTAIEGARRGVGPNGADPLAFMIFPIGAVVMFAGFIGAALWKRRQPEIHRRLIILGTVSIMTPAIARLSFVGKNAVFALALSLLFIIAGMIHDWKIRGRVHHIYIWGAPLIFLSGPARAMLGQTAAWQAFARFLVG
jgi:hypothetical protein